MNILLMNVENIYAEAEKRQKQNKLLSRLVWDFEITPFIGFQFWVNFALISQRRYFYADAYFLIISR